MDDVEAAAADALGFLATGALLVVSFFGAFCTRSSNSSSNFANVLKKADVSYASR